MQAKQQTEILPCTPGAFPGGLSRTRFYDGMLLSQAHLEREQFYWRMKRKLTNRALGTGVVWGLRLDWDDGKRKFSLSPGYALDCCGNDLVVECPQEITERALIDKHDPNVQALLNGSTSTGERCPTPRSEQARKACVALKYVECAGDPEPVFDDDCTSNVTNCEYSSIRESAQLCLVPPPADPEPGPIDEFCRRLEALKASCSELADCTLFEPDVLSTQRAFPVVIEVRNLGDGTVTGADAVLFEPGASDSGALVEASLGEVDGGDQLQVVVRPAPGYVLTGGHLDTDGSSFPPFGGDFEHAADIFSGAAGVPIAIRELRVESLLTNETHVQANLTFSLTISGTEGSFSVATSDFQRLPSTPTCNDKLASWLIFDKSAECTLKSTALVALCGWFRGLLADDANATLTGKHATGWAVCYLAWQVLFGANMDDAEASSLHDALRELLDAWCAAFMYPGPYCADDHHGIYLGCVELSEKGNVVSFDPWAHRRYVLTGPLLTYWGQQLGLAPVDVVAGRFADWICCLGKSQVPAMSGQLVASMLDGVPVSRDGAALIAGGQPALDAYVTRYNLSLTSDAKRLSMSDFASQIAWTAWNSGDGGSNTLSAGRRAYELEETGLFLLEPVSIGLAAVRPPVTELAPAAAFANTRTASLAPLARGLVTDYAVEVAAKVELSKLKALTDNEPLSALVGEMNSNGIVTVEDYLNVGPEAGAKLAISNFDELDDFDTEREVYAAAEELTLASEAVIEAVVVPFAENKIDTGGGPVLGENLVQARNVSEVGRSIRPLLKQNAMTNKRLKKIGLSVAERRSGSPSAVRE